MREEILKKLYSSGFVENYCHKLRGTDKNIKDKTQDIWLLICELDENYLISLFEENKLLNYISGLIYRQLISDTSKLYYKYDKHERPLIYKNFEEYE